MKFRFIKGLEGTNCDGCRRGYGMKVREGTRSSMRMTVVNGDEGESELGLMRCR